MTKANQIPPFRIEAFSDKQKKVLTWWRDGSPYSDYDGIIADGSIRSGKTIVFIIAFIIWSTTVFRDRNFILSGRTIGTLKRNVINPMLRILNTLGVEYSYNRSGNFITFCTNTYYLFGADNEASPDLVQGLTAAGWLADEVALHHPEFIKQALGRLTSIENSKFWWNCNPENPNHPVKSEYINNAEEKHILHLHFNLDDNLTLTQKAKDRAKRMFAGVFYKRMILGLWVAAEGAIYDMLDEEKHVVDTLPAMTKHWVAFDYGPSGVTCAWLLGYGTDKKLYFIDFWRWDVKDKYRALDDVEVTDAVDAWLDNLGITPDDVIIPTVDARNLYTAMDNLRRKPGRLKRIKRLAHADQRPGAVLRRVRMCGMLFNQGMLFFHRRIVEKGGLAEWQGYVWDPKKQEEGKDAPLDRDDHDPDCGGYAVTFAAPTVYRNIRNA